MNPMIERPTVETLFRRLIDNAGYHDAESIPTAKVFEMFKAFFEYENQMNNYLMKTIAEYEMLAIKPIVYAPPIVRDAE